MQTKEKPDLRYTLRVLEQLYKNDQENQKGTPTPRGSFNKAKEAIVRANLITLMLRIFATALGITVFILFCMLMNVK